MRFLRTFFVEINRKYRYNISMGKRTYEQVLYEINNARRFGKAPGVEIIGKILQILRKTENDLGRIPFVHIAGTNGKGSVCAFLDTIFQKAGYCTGRFTSPHLIEFEERITVDGKMIPKAAVERIGNMLLDADFGISLTMFDYCLMMALIYFKECGCGIMIIETGLGGRLDCTNIITPVLSVITNISFDHTQFLGNTLAEIAGEKAGIIKPDVPVVIGEYIEETRPVFEKVAEERHSPILFAQDEDISMNVDMELKGSYQERNRKTILAALNVLRQTMTISDEAIRNGFGHVCELTGLRGRWEKLGEAPLVICDTGHNLAGWKYLATQINDVDAQVKHIVFGMVDDKDVEHVLQLLRDKLKNGVKFYWTQPSTKRAIPVEKLRDTALKYNLHGEMYHSVKEAYMTAKANAKNDDFVFVGGSSYVVADLLS